jgi:hypothetical protein
MATSEPDLEYGPNPPGARYEHTDIEPEFGYRFAAWLAVAMLISAGIIYGAFWMFDRQEKAASPTVLTYPLAAGVPKEPPSPRLQTQPFKDVYLLRQSEADVLGSYGWVDRPAGIVHLPIERAMELTLERGLPSRGEGSAVTPIVADSSAGRTTTAR